jgi:hypothetical protein
MKKATYLAMTVIALLLVSAINGHAGGYYGGGHYRGGWGGGPAFRGGVWIGPGWGAWGPGWGGWGWGLPVYPYYATTEVIIQQQPPVYVEPQQSQPEEEGYWYYCQNPQGYYPYVKKCPNGWMKVVPSPTQPDPRQ